MKQFFAPIISQLIQNFEVLVQVILKYDKIVGISDGVYLYVEIEVILWWVYLWKWSGGERDWQIVITCSWNSNGRVAPL